MTPPPVLEAKGVGRRFGARIALQGVDLAVGSGEAVALFGGNGAGKTTLLKIACGLLRASEGSIAVRGVDPRRAGDAARSAVGYLSHRTLLYDDLSPSENLHVFARLHGLPDAASRVTAALERFGTAERRDDPVRTLSRGLQQRVALARALLHDPALLLLDEPTVALDVRAAALLASALAAARARGAAALVATHEFAAGLALCSRYLVLDRGRVVASGRTEGTSAAEIAARAAGPA